MIRALLALVIGAILYTTHGGASAQSLEAASIESLQAEVSLPKTISARSDGEVRLAQH